MTSIQNMDPPSSNLNKLLSLYKAGDLGGAASFCDVLLAAYPDSAQVYNVLGVILEAQGKVEDALTAYDKATQKKPDHLNAYHNAGVLLSTLGRFEDARDKYAKIIELEPEDGDAHNNLGVILQRLDEHRLAFLPL